MIKYKGIEFLTVDQLIEYQEKAEGLKKPIKTLLEGITINPGIFTNDPPPFYPRQPDPWIQRGPNQFTFPLSPTCDSRDTIITNMHSSLVG